MQKKNHLFNPKKGLNLDRPTQLEICRFLPGKLQYLTLVPIRDSHSIRSFTNPEELRRPRRYFDLLRKRRAGTTENRLGQPVLMENPNGLREPFV
jgi:hypothetical protein